MTTLISSTSPSSPTPAFDHPEDTNNDNIGYAIPYSLTGCDESSPREEKPFVAVDQSNDLAYHEFEALCTKALSVSFQFFLSSGKS
jgi:hypothetical protein